MVQICLFLIPWDNVRNPCQFDIYLINVLSWDGSPPCLTTHEREVSVLEVRIELGDLNPRLLIPQSVTLPTLPHSLQHSRTIKIKLNCMFHNELHIWTIDRHDVMSNIFRCLDVDQSMKHEILLSM